jgi:hypothetical protein
MLLKVSFNELKLLKEITIAVKRGKSLTPVATTSAKPWPFVD